MEEDNKEVKKKKSKSSLIIIIVVVCLVVGIGTFLATNYFFKSNVTEIEEVTLQNNLFFNVGEITINIKSETSHKNYAKVNLDLSYDKSFKKLSAELEEKRSIITDTCIFYFKSLTLNDFSAENEILLKENLKNKINEILENGELTSIIFTMIQVQ